MKTEITQETEYDEVMQEAEKVNGVNFIISNKITKSDIPALADLLVRNILNNGNPLAAAENIKKMKLILEGVESDKRFKDYALEELAKYGKKYTSPSGICIEPFEAGGRYDYKTCGDPIVIELETKLKERQEFLKKLPKDGIDIVTDEGEVVHVYPPAKPASTSTYKITLPR